MPRVLNLKHTGYRVPPGAVYVGRAMRAFNLTGSEYGNPFKPKDRTLASRRVCLAKYQAWVEVRLVGEPDWLEPLRGKDLCCWCHEWSGEGPNPYYCHCDILIGKLYGVW